MLNKLSIGSGKKLLILFISIAAALIVSSCFNTNIESENAQNNGRVVGFVHGIITDGNTGTVVQNVEISWVHKGNVNRVKTDIDGYYTLSNLVSGSHLLTIKSEGHAIVTRTIVIPNLSEIGIIDIPTGEDFHHSMIQNYTLFQQKSSFTGSVYARITEDELRPASNVVVTATLPTGFIPAVYFATTNNDGKYAFTDMPSYNGDIIFRIEGSYMVGNLTYSTNSTRNSNPIYDQNVEINRFIMTLDEVDVFVISNNMSSYLPGRSIEFTFNRDIQASSFSVDVYADYYYEYVPIRNVTWLASNRVRITPDENLESETRYTFFMSGIGNVRNEVNNFSISLSLWTPYFE